MLTNVFQSASRMVGHFIEDPDTCDGVSRAHAPSRSHRLPEQWVHGAKELAELPNQAKQWQLPFDRIQIGMTVALLRNVSEESVARMAHA